MAGIEQCSLAAIRAAFHKVGDSPSYAKGRELFDRVRDGGNSVLYSSLMADTANANLGRFCKAVARESGVADPPEYALLDKQKTPEGLRLTIKPCALAALAS